MSGIIIGIVAKVVVRTWAGLWMAGVGCMVADKIQNKVANVKARRQSKKEQVVTTMVVRDYIN